MKRIAALLAITALVVCLISPAQAEETDWERVYAPVLASAAQLLSCENPEEHVLASGEMGIQEIRMGTDDAPRKVGYAFQDLNKDGTSELIIAQVDSQESEQSYGKQILSVFTSIQGLPHLLAEGWARNRYYLLSDGTLLNQGSSGAAYSCLGLFQLDETGTSLNCLDFYFTWEENNEIVTYYNTDGTFEVPHEENQRIDLDFPRMSEILEEDAQPISLTPFAFYLKEEHPSLLVAQWNPYSDVENCVIVSDEKYSTQIVLCAYEGQVTEVQLLRLELEEGDNIRFKQTVLETVPSIEPGNPLIVQLAFGCTIPNFGVRYTDDSGVTRAFSIMQSGMDGSLLMTEIE